MVEIVMDVSGHVTEEIGIVGECIDQSNSIDC